MAVLDYLDFDLHVQRVPEGYRLHVLNSPAGQASGVFKLPFSDLEIENFLLRIGRPRRGTRRAQSPETEAVKQFGGMLFSSLFQNEVFGCWSASFNEAARRDVGLRIRLRLADAPELSDIPWEFLYSSAKNQFLALSPRTPVLRYLEMAEPVRPLLVAPPLRVLVVISSPGNYPKLDVEREWARLNEGLQPVLQRGTMELVRVDIATLGELQRQLRRSDFHIFHFIGHGAFDREAGDGVLIFEDESGLGRPVSGQDLGVFLHDTTVRLAVLNACEGARAARTDPFAGTAQSLTQQGLPAVIAMQFEITDEAAIVFAREFYSALADGYPVDASLSEARKAIFGNDCGVEWGTPVLYLRAPDGRIFDIANARREIAAIPAASLPVSVIAVRSAWSTILPRIKQLTNNSWQFKIPATTLGWVGVGMVLALAAVGSVVGIKHLVANRKHEVSQKSSAIVATPAQHPAQPAASSASSTQPAAHPPSSPATAPAVAPAATPAAVVPDAAPTNPVVHSPVQPPQAHVPAGPRIVVETEQVSRTRLLQHPAPTFAPNPQLAGTQGNLVFHVLIGVDGKVKTADLAEGPSQLESVAKEAVRKWQYRKLVVDGQPAQVKTSVTVPYVVPRTATIAAVAPAVPTPPVQTAQPAASQSLCSVNVTSTRDQGLSLGITFHFDYHGSQPLSDLRVETVPLDAASKTIPGMKFTSFTPSSSSGDVAVSIERAPTLKGAAPITSEFVAIVFKSVTQNKNICVGRMPFHKDW